VTSTGNDLNGCLISEIRARHHRASLSILSIARDRLIGYPIARDSIAERFLRTSCDP